MPLLRGLLAAWLALASASAQDATPKPDEDILRIRECIVEGRRHEDARRLDAAIEAYRKALDISEKKYPFEFSTALCLDHLGTAHLNRGEYEEAARHLRRAVQVLEVALKNIREAEPESVPAAFARGVAALRAKAVHGLAVAYDYLADYARAEPLYEQALAEREKIYGPDHTEVAESLNFLGNIYLVKADYARAAQTFRRALAINEKNYRREDPRVTTMMSNLAYAYASLGESAKTEELLKEAIARAETWPNPDSLQMAYYLNNLGDFYGVKEPARARPLLERSLAIREKLLGPEDPLVASTINNLAMLDWRAGELKRAEAGFRRAVDIQQKALGPSHPDVAHALSNLAMLHLAMGETQRGIGLLAEGSRYSEHNLLAKMTTGSEEQKRTFMASIEEGTSAMVTLSLRVAPGDEQAARLALSTVLWRKGRVLDVLSGQVAAVLGVADAESVEAHARLTAARSRLSNLSTLMLKGLGGDEAQQRATAETVKSEIQSLEKVISERAAALGAGSGSVTTETVQAAIPEGAALVEIIQFRPAPIGAANGREWEPPRYAALVLRRAGAPASIDLGEAAKIDADVERLRRALGSPVSRNVRALARVVDEEVMRPVRKLLGDVKHVLVSPDGSLNLVPFAALVDERDRYLIETYTFTFLPSGRDLLRQSRRTSEAQGPVVVANPLFDTQPSEASKPSAGTGSRAANLLAKFTPLAATADEAREVSGILRGARTLTGAQATEAAVKRVKSPSVLHIATHGFFSKAAGTVQTLGARTFENPLLRSGLALAGANRLDGGEGEDGILMALEAAALDLRGTRLVVLSACETGVGEVASGEGVYGLRRALALAGAESQLISLWKVDDEATRELMGGFYRKLTAGVGRSESLRQAQLKLLGGGEYSHPHLWAGFIMSGRWESLK